MIENKNEKEFYNHQFILVFSLIDVWISSFTSILMGNWHETLFVVACYNTPWGDFNQL